MGLSYLLDTNIIIKIWTEDNQILEGVDFFISNETFQELSVREIDKVTGEFSKRLVGLTDKVIQNNAYSGNPSWREWRFLVEKDGEICYREGNRVSNVDYGLISMCQNNSTLILVTNDKKMLRSGRLVLTKNRIINYEEFLKLMK